MSTGGTNQAFMTQSSGLALFPATPIFLLLLRLVLARRAASKRLTQKAARPWRPALPFVRRCRPLPNRPSPSLGEGYVFPPLRGSSGQVWTSEALIFLGSSAGEGDVRHTAERAGHA